MLEDWARPMYSLGAPAASDKYKNVPGHVPAMSRLFLRKVLYNDQGQATLAIAYLSTLIPWPLYAGHGRECIYRPADDVLRCQVTRGMGLAVKIV